MADTEVTPLTAITVAASTDSVTLPGGTRSYTMASSAATLLFHGTSAVNPGFPLAAGVKWGPYGGYDIDGATLHFSGTGTVNIFVEIGGGG